ncbi:MAG: TetR/AcrR family transcriptional regulator [Candidatus Aminicenantes bacterium]|nr:MAG: TetR/AcrR family transcriptional regulator [Candidatus Aminicenantes bacterium]
MVVVKSEVRAGIVDVARKIFTRYGFRKTTMEEIAKASGKGKSSVYYYFPSKEEIFKAVVEKEASELKEHLDKTIHADVPPIDKLKTYILFRLHHVRTVGNFYAALNEESLSHLDFILEIRKNFDQDELQAVKGILEEGMAEGSFQINNPEIGAIAIATMMKGLELPLLLSDHHKTDRAELLDDLIRVLFYGIVKR